MVVLSRIYTKSGDDGTTGLGSGERVMKDDPRVVAFGAVDEANTTIGVARLHAKDDAHLDAHLERIQHDLFDLGADLCTIEAKRGEPLRIIDEQVKRLEREIDDMNANLQPLRSFVLPGGTALSAHLHMARAVTRRAEQQMVTLSRTEDIGHAAMHYINRLSDFLFVAARHANAKGEGDVLWVPGATRS